MARKFKRHVFLPSLRPLYWSRENFSSKNLSFWTSWHHIFVLTTTKWSYTSTGRLQMAAGTTGLLSYYKDIDTWIAWASSFHTICHHITVFLRRTSGPIYGTVSHFLLEDKALVDDELIIVVPTGQYSAASWCFIPALWHSLCCLIPFNAKVNKRERERLDETDQDSRRERGAV